MASLWSACFRVANAMAIAVSAIPMAALVLFVGSAIAGSNGVAGWQSSGLGAAQIAVVLLVASLVGWTAVSAALLIPLTLGLVQRQRTRKTLVRVGRSRSWVARPGEGGYAPASASQSARIDGYDEDRIVERSPSQAGQLIGGPSSGGPDFGGPGSGGPGSGGPGFGGPGQASLYSPSTTSSFPWSGDPPVEPD